MQRETEVRYLEARRRGVTPIIRVLSIRTKQGVLASCRYHAAERGYNTLILPISPHACRLMHSTRFSLWRTR